MIQPRQNGFLRWILPHPDDPGMAWSGSRWVPIDRHGFGVAIQVCNFDTRKEALEYAQEHHTEMQ